MGSEFIVGLDYFKWDRTHTRATTPETIETQPFGVADLDQTNIGVYGRGTLGLTDDFTLALGFRHEQQEGEAVDSVDVISSDAIWHHQQCCHVKVTNAQKQRL